jgi:hypothetical protein
MVYNILKNATCDDDTSRFVLDNQPITFYGMLYVIEKMGFDLSEFDENFYPNGAYKESVLEFFDFVIELEYIDGYNDSYIRFIADSIEIQMFFGSSVIMVIVNTTEDKMNQFNSIFFDVFGFSNLDDGEEKDYLDII